MTEFRKVLGCLLLVVDTLVCFFLFPWYVVPFAVIGLQLLWMLVFEIVVGLTTGFYELGIEIWGKLKGGRA